jgi:hypothetical protein
MFQKPLFKKWSFQGASYFYVNQEAERIGGGGLGTIITSGSSTTITSATSRQAFSQAAVGDEMRIVLGGSVQIGGLGEFQRFITAKASHDSVTVDSAINIATASPWFHIPQRGSTADTDGWVNVQFLKDKLVYIQLVTKGTAAGITYSIQVRGAQDNAVPREVLTGTLTTAVVTTAGVTTIDTTAADTFVIAEEAQDLRVGIKNDNSAIDVVSAWVTGEVIR